MKVSISCFVGFLIGLLFSVTCSASLLSSSEMELYGGSAGIAALYRKVKTSRQWDPPLEEIKLLAGNPYVAISNIGRLCLYCFIIPNRNKHQEKKEIVISDARLLRCQKAALVTAQQFLSDSFTSSNKDYLIATKTLLTIARRIEVKLCQIETGNKQLKCLEKKLISLGYNEDLPRERSNTA